MPATYPSEVCSTACDAYRVGRSTAFGVVTFAFTVTMAGTTLPTPLYPLYQQRFGFGGLMATVIYATYAVGVIAALLLFGSFSDQIGRRWMLLQGLLLSAASAVEFLATGSTWTGAGGIVTLIAGRVLSGVSAGIFTGTATAALVDLARRPRPSLRVPQPRARRASLVAAAANMGGLGLGALLSGGLAEYAPQPLRLCFIVDLALLALAAIGILLIPEPGRNTGPVVLRVQRLRVPPQVRGTFVRAAAPGFAGFAALGLFTAVSAALLGQVLHNTNHALAGLLAFAGFAASLAGQGVSMAFGREAAVGGGAMAERRALLAGCFVLVLGLAVVAASLLTASLPLLVAGAIVCGLGQGPSFRAGLALVNAGSPAGQRAEVASSFFVTLYIALSIPVIGVGAAAQSVGLVRAGIVFAAVVAVLPLAASVSLLYRRPEPARYAAPRALPAPPR
jgi:MFS family permease